MAKKALQPSTLPKPPNFSQGVEASGRMVFISGLVSIDASGTTIAPGDIEGQTRHIFQNMENIVKEAGGTRAARRRRREPRPGQGYGLRRTLLLPLLPRQGP